MCSHQRTEHISGDLICLSCGKVIQSNSLLSTELSVAEALQETHKQSKLTSIPIQLKPSLTHEAKSLAELRTLAANLISSFALKPGYEDEAFHLMANYWEINKSTVKFGKSGNRLLVACLFLLARRDHLAINFSSLAEYVQSSRFECGHYLNSIIQIEPSLRTLADPGDFTEHEITTLASLLSQRYGLVIAESKIHELSRQAGKLSSLESDTGSSSSSQSIALAASWIVLDAFLHSDMDLFDALLKEKAVEQVVRDVIDDNTSLSLRSVTSKRNALITELLEIGKSCLPSTFGSLKLSKSRQLLLMFSLLDEILVFVNM